MMPDAALFHDDISHMPAWDSCINRYVFIVERAMPYVMISFPSTDEGAAVFYKNFPDDFFIFRHYKHTFA
jgi:hypothetical protein